MYDVAIISCTNTGCTKEFNIDQINNYEFFGCPFRLIKCLAKNCSYRNNPNGVHKHALECPFQSFYCSTWYGDYGVEVLSHSCTKKLQRLLAESLNSPLEWVPTILKHAPGDIILPNHVTLQPFEMDALTDAQLGLTLRSALFSSSQGVTEVAQRRRVLQCLQILPRGLDEVDLRSNDSENDISQFNLSWLF